MSAGGYFFHEHSKNCEFDFTETFTQRSAEYFSGRRPTKSPKTLDKTAVRQAERNAPCISRRETTLYLAYC